MKEEQTFANLGDRLDQIEVDIVGYSRGADAMVTVSNALASEGTSTNMMADIDGKLGASNNSIYSATPTLRVFRPDSWTPVQMLTPLVGSRGIIFQGGNNKPAGTTGVFGTTHGGMDQYGSGALGATACWMLGGNP